jgi:hypothetical protein
MKGLPRKCYAKSISLGGRNSLASILPITQDGAGLLRISVACDTAQLLVQVRDSDDEPVPDAFVVISPSEVQTEVDLSGSMLVGVTNAKGEFTADALPPGKHVVFAVQRVIDIDQETIARLWRARSTARAVEAKRNDGLVIRISPSSID